VTNETTFAALMIAARTIDKAFAQKPGETPQKFLGRLLEVVAETDQEVFDAMGEPAQDWHVLCARSLNEAIEAGKNVADVSFEFPEGYEAPAETAKAPTKAKTPTAKKPAAAPKEKAPKAVKEAKAPKAAKEPKPPKEPKAPRAKKEKAPKAPREINENSSSWFIRSAVINNFAITAKTIKEMLAEKGFSDVKDSLVTTCMSDTRATLRVLKKEEHWSNH
jgi:hypothetical protein